MAGNFPSADVATPTLLNPRTARWFRNRWRVGVWPAPPAPVDGPALPAALPPWRWPLPLHPAPIGNVWDLVGRGHAPILMSSPDHSWVARPEIMTRSVEWKRRPQEPPKGVVGPGEGSCSQTWQPTHPPCGPTSPGRCCPISHCRVYSPATGQNFVARGEPPRIGSRTKVGPVTAPGCCGAGASGFRLPRCRDTTGR